VRSSTDLSTIAAMGSDARSFTRGLLSHLQVPSKTEWPCLSQQMFKIRANPLRSYLHIRTI